MQIINTLTARQKAAVIVQILLAEGSDLSLANLPPETQTSLAKEMLAMEMIDVKTRDAVVAEFCDQLDAVGLSFSGDINGTIDFLGRVLSEDITDRLRRMAIMAGHSDPWDRIAAMSPDILTRLAQSEATEIAAVMLTKLPVDKAAEILGLLPPSRARQIAYAMSMVGGIESAPLRRIGLALLQATDGMARPAMIGGPVERVGAILNSSTSMTRDDVLTGLESDNTNFAQEVRKTIFTWANIPARIDVRDIARIIREVEPPILLKAIADPSETSEFVLSNISTRMAETLREDAGALGKVTPQDAESAQAEFVTAIRRMEKAGDLFLIPPPEPPQPDLA